ncbi:hypothetical protein TSUD_333650 [Trifolium subterraneum]|uniref:Uncharacterized protein n=1 Tax=Trifolium subterraneum TaxID=3900 RepID=A0A2Z6N8V6_TRISU|nr:hypothetical protein TSUD_333650 [Trifolium subterraneum]
MLGPFLRNGLVPISLLGPLAREARPNCPLHGFCAMLFLLVVRVSSFVVCDLRWLELDLKKKVDSVLGKTVRMFEIDVAILLEWK